MKLVKLNFQVEDFISDIENFQCSFLIFSQDYNRAYMRRVEQEFKHLNLNCKRILFNIHNFYLIAYLQYEFLGEYKGYIHLPRNPIFTQNYTMVKFTIYNQEDRSYLFQIHYNINYEKSKYIGIKYLPKFTQQKSLPSITKKVHLIYFRFTTTQTMKTPNAKISSFLLDFELSKSLQILFHLPRILTSRCLILCFFQQKLPFEEIYPLSYTPHGPFYKRHFTFLGSLNK